MSFWDTVNVIASKASEVLSTLGGEDEEQALHNNHESDSVQQMQQTQACTVDKELAQMQKVRVFPVPFYLSVTCAAVRCCSCLFYKRTVPTFR
jgi:hypothetical protein